MERFDFKKSLGQNFLIDDNIKRKIVGSANVDSSSIIVEVGPGGGAITKYLVELGVPVLAFEIDTRLKEELSKINNSNLEIVFEDFLQVDINKYLNKYNKKNVHLIANLPYYITTPIINKMIEEVLPYEMIVMVQKEVGDRFKAKPNTKEYNSLSVFLQYYYNIEKVTTVSRNSFVPKPNIDSIVIKFNKKSELLKLKNDKDFFKLVKDSFKQKRKNLRNNLREYDLILLEEALNKLGKDLTYRAEQLSLEDFVFISNYIAK